MKSSLSEHRSKLRSQIFPQNVSQCLQIVFDDHVTLESRTSSEPSKDLVDEFVFGHQSAVEHLQVVHTVLKFFEDSQKELAHLTTFFLILFDVADANLCSRRLQILAKLTSLALVNGSERILHCSATWMQNQSSLSTDCMDEFAHLLLNEHILMLSNPSQSGLKIVSRRSPLFAANLIGILANFDKFEDVKEPQEKVLQLFITWLKENPALITSKISDQKGIKCSSSVVPAKYSPLMGLSQWSILAPTFPNYQLRNESYWHLQRLLLESLLVTQAELEKHDLSGIVSGKQLSTLILRVQETLLNLEPSSDNEMIKGDVLDRLGQILHGLVASGCLKDKKLDDWVPVLKSLPENYLINALIDRQSILQGV